ncbi:hypothetical protein B0O99DRAFT_686843 [Bisporella sp. PMI_857]|nr:hypothetical protein B0O99DRAFT_686843 [Bisporella sp. PMI_857]
MAGRIDLLWQIVRNILPALGMPDVDDGELGDLTLRISHREDDDDVSSQTTPSHTPPSTNTVVRTSNRQLGTKRSYEGMQSRHGGSRKKFKCTIKEANGSNNTIDESTNSGAVTNAPAEVIKEPVKNTISAGLSINLCPSDKPLTNSLIAETTIEMTLIPAKDHLNTETTPYIVGNGTFTSDPSIADCFKTGTSSFPLNERISMRRPVVADSAVLGRYTLLTNTEPTEFARIITNIGTTCVKSNLTSLAFTLEIEKERLQEYSRDRLSQTKQDCKQMTLFMNVREIANRDSKDVLSKPMELIREFKEEDEFEKLIGQVDRETPVMQRNEVERL